MLQIVVGHSNDPDSKFAINEVLAQCAETLQGQTPQAGLLFAAIDFEHPMILDQILNTFPEIQLIGGTTDGEVSSKMGFQEDSLVLMLFCADTLTIRTGIGRAVSKDPLAAAQQAFDLTESNPSSAIDLCITIPDGISCSGVAMINALKQILGKDTPIVGGTAADQFQFQQSYQFYQGEVLSDALPILVFSGGLKISHGFASGWQPISRKAVITRAEGARVFEIDQQPALDFYDHYLNGLPITGEYPLAVFEGGSEDFYLRASNSCDRNDGSILFMGDVPEQATVQITHATCDDIIAAAKTSILQAQATYPGEQPAAALLFSCAARRWLLGSRVQEEYELGRQVLDPSIPVSGFYTYGEIAPLSVAGETQFHQETLVTLLLGEA